MIPPSTFLDDWNWEFSDAGLSRNNSRDSIDKNLDLREELDSKVEAVVLNQSTNNKEINCEAERNLVRLECLPSADRPYSEFLKSSSDSEIGETIHSGDIPHDVKEKDLMGVVTLKFFCGTWRFIWIFGIA